MDLNILQILYLLEFQNTKNEVESQGFELLLCQKIHTIIPILYYEILHIYRILHYNRHFRLYK